MESVVETNMSGSWFYKWLNLNDVDDGQRWNFVDNTIEIKYKSVIYNSFSVHKTSTSS
jgi:hypothetical protein